MACAIVLMLCVSAATRMGIPVGAADTAAESVLPAKCSGKQKQNMLCAHMDVRLCGSSDAEQVREECPQLCGLCSTSSTAPRTTTQHVAPNQHLHDPEHPLYPHHDEQHLHAGPDAGAGKAGRVEEDNGGEGDQSIAPNQHLLDPEHPYHPDNEVSEGSGGLSNGAQELESLGSEPIDPEMVANRHLLDPEHPQHPSNEHREL